ncbi:hypothetical protein LX36DRAFT_286783 [Colletotrichum falcatum]|nr:hypothetical protein LX36DRAFT_286783 [Colletotrichum falcatum]
MQCIRVSLLRLACGRWSLRPPPPLRPGAASRPWCPPPPCSPLLLPRFLSPSPGVSAQSPPPFPQLSTNR